jgi:hypothetical protein
MLVSLHTVLHYICTLFAVVLGRCLTPCVCLQTDCVVLCTSPCFILYAVSSPPPPNCYMCSFPIKAPDGALTRDDVSALSQLELCLAYQRHWCEHKPSITVTVREDEWMDVGAWVYRHFDEVSGEEVSRCNGRHLLRPIQPMHCDQSTHGVAQCLVC